MSQGAPWINLTTNNPGLNAQHRNTINEWCGAVGRQGKYHRKPRSTIQFPSLAVNWKGQRRANGHSLKASTLLSGGEEDVPSRLSCSGRRTKSRINPSPRVEVCDNGDLDEKDPKRHHVKAILWKDGSMGIRVDPFDCIPGTTADSRQGEIIDYYKQILDPGVVATFFIFNMRSIYGSIPLECLADEEFRPLGLASIAGTMSSVKHGAVNRQYVFAQLGKGMRMLRQRLSRPGGADEDIALVSALFLAATAYATGDPEGFEIHRAHLKQMVASRGGLDHLGHGGTTKTCLLQWDASWKLSTGKSLWIDDQPRKEPLYTTLPLNDRFLALVEALPIGFRELCKTQVFSVDLLRILSRMNTAMTLRLPARFPYDQKSQQYDDYLSACSSLQNLGAEDNSRPSLPTLEVLLGLALLLFSSTAFNEMRATPTIFRGPRDALYGLLIHFELNSPAFSRDLQRQCLIWIWAVAVDSWRDASRELMPRGCELLTMFHGGYASYWETADGLVDTLKRFFWTKDLVKFHKESFESFQSKSKQN